MNCTSELKCMNCDTNGNCFSPDSYNIYGVDEYGSISGE